MNESVEDFITIYPKMVGMEMGLYVPLIYAWEPTTAVTERLVVLIRNNPGVDNNSYFKKYINDIKTTRNCVGILRKYKNPQGI